MAKTYTAPTTVSAGDAITASLYNTYVGTNVANLIVPPAVRLVKTANQNIASSTSVAATWPTAVYDTDSMYSAANTSRITINTAGIYVVSACATFANNATGERIFYIIRNGNDAVRLSFARIDGSSGPTAQSLSTSVQLSATDYIELVVYQSSGTTLNLLGDVLDLTSFSATWIGRTS